MSRSSRSVQRVRSTRRERRTVLVVTEGQTEKEYVEGLRQHLRPSGSQVTAYKVVNGKGEPRRVLRTAMARMDEAEFDSVWLLLDVDDHRELEPVVTEASAMGMHAAVSNPCFEVWVVWHFENVGHDTDRDTVQRMARRHGVDKSIPTRFPYDKRSEASARAAIREVRVNCIGPNPSTAMPQFIAFLCD